MKQMTTEMIEETKETGPNDSDDVDMSDIEELQDIQIIEPVRYKKFSLDKNLGFTLFEDENNDVWLSIKNLAQIRAKNSVNAGKHKINCDKIAGKFQIQPNYKTLRVMVTDKRGTRQKYDLECINLETALVIILENNKKTRSLHFVCRLCKAIFWREDIVKQNLSVISLLQ